jgi:hypothetical protein
LDDEVSKVASPDRRQKEEEEEEEARARVFIHMKQGGD